MTAAEWCVFGTLMLYLLTIVPIKWIGFRRFDNGKPRDPASYADPIAARALGAHQNGIEAFPFFAVAVLLAELRAGPQRLIDELAVLFLIVRIAYVLDLSRRPPDPALDPVEPRLRDKPDDLLHAGDQGWLPVG